MFSAEFIAFVLGVNTVFFGLSLVLLYKLVDFAKDSIKEFINELKKIDD